MFLFLFVLFFFFFNDPATTEIYTLSLHDALPISRAEHDRRGGEQRHEHHRAQHVRSEEHTSELQSHSDLVCRPLLEKKKKTERRRGSRSSRSRPTSRTRGPRLP